MSHLKATGLMADYVSATVFHHPLCRTRDENACQLILNLSRSRQVENILLVFYQKRHDKDRNMLTIVFIL